MKKTYVELKEERKIAINKHLNILKNFMNRGVINE